MTFWKDKRVFITGHTGFKGGWLSLWLNDLGAVVTGFSLPAPTQPSLYDAARIGDVTESLMGDVRDLQKLTEALGKSGAEIVIHLAAQSLVRTSYSEPVETFASNVMGTVNLLEAVRRCPAVRAVLVVTSDKCYENREWPWGYRETDAMGGYDPYSCSKGCAELVVSAYRNSYFTSTAAREREVSVASARAGNVIGGGDWAKDRLIPDLVRAVTQGTQLEIRNPGAIRPWQHVLEPLSGYLELVRRMWGTGQRYAEAWNFGPSDSTGRCVSYIVRKMLASWGMPPEFVTGVADGPHETRSLRVDTSKSNALLGWYCVLDTDQMIEWVGEWYQAYLAGEDIRAYSLEQIHRYCELRRHSEIQPAMAGTSGSVFQ